MISVAIDGPAGAGKSTIARKAAARLGYLYIDTGALYRAVGLAVLRAGKSPDCEGDVAACLPEIMLELGHEKGVQQVCLNGENVSQDIRAPEVSVAASKVSAFPQVRAFLLDRQRDIAKRNNVIMDGRDIGTVVLPDADVKIFLTASPEERARRRYEELLEKGRQADYETVFREVVERDYQDSHRSAAPLKQAEDAVLADTTGFPLERSVELVTRLIEEGVQKRGRP